MYIFVDQTRKYVLGCYGNTVVPTPDFDALAAAWIVFDNTNQYLGFGTRP